MRRLFVALGLPALLLLAGCGGSSSASVTAQLSAAGVQGSMVVTTDSGAIAAVRTDLKADQLSTSGITLVDGDQHSGNHVCGYSVSKNGHNYQVDFYGNSAQSSSLFASGCSSTEQQAFLNRAP
jgi:hypothetical protein